MTWISLRYIKLQRLRPDFNLGLQDNRIKSCRAAPQPVGCLLEPFFKEKKPLWVGFNAGGPFTCFPIQRCPPSSLGMNQTLSVQTSVALFSSDLCSAFWAGTFVSWFSRNTCKYFSTRSRLVNFWSCGLLGGPYIHPGAWNSTWLLTMFPKYAGTDKHAHWETEVEASTFSIFYIRQ